MERSPPTSGRFATPADINRNGRPTSIGTGGRHQSECPADIVGIRSASSSRRFHSAQSALVGLLSSRADQRSVEREAGSAE